MRSNSWSCRSRASSAASSSFTRAGSSRAALARTCALRCWRRAVPSLRSVSRRLAVSWLSDSSCWAKESCEPFTCSCRASHREETEGVSSLTELRTRSPEPSSRVRRPWTSSAV
ncbi:hypothetical protein ACN28S_25740 [Cystobacter fuscus]